MEEGKEPGLSSREDGVEGGLPKPMLLPLLLLLLLVLTLRRG